MSIASVPICIPFVQLLVRSITVCLFLAAAGNSSYAQNIIIDNSLVPEQTLLGPDYQVGASLGHQVDGNRFLSYSELSLLTGESLRFIELTGVNNLINRVTGLGKVSNLDGPISTEIPGVNVFLLNPNGVIFGPNASLNVGGAFRVSTADFARMEGGAQFFANLTDTSTLSSAPVVAFGFLAGNPAGITLNQSSLEAPVGKTLSLIGGDLDIKGSGGLATSLFASSGRVELVSVASAGIMPIVTEGAVPAFSTTSFTNMGAVRLTDGALVGAPSSASAPAGEIVIRGGRVTLDNASAIFASTNGAASAPPVGIDVNVRVAVPDGVSSSSVVLDRSSAITSTNNGGGNAGAIRIVGESISGSAPGSVVELKNGSTINTFFFGNGNASDLTVQADSIRLMSGGKIQSENLGANNSGNGGTIRLQAGREISIGSQSGIVAANLQGFGAGSPIQAISPRMTIEGAGGLNNEAVISGFTGGNGTAASVTLNVGTLELKGQQSFVDTRARSISLVGGQVPSNGGGPVIVQGIEGAGTVADLVSISGPGSGFLTETEGLGPGGDMSFHAATMTLTNQSRVSSNTKGAGSAGTITLDVGTLEVRGGARIEGNTVGPGAGGLVVVQGLKGLGSSANLVTLNGRDALGNVSGLSGGTISVSSTSSGNAGGITVNVGTQSITEGGRIESSTTGTGNGGTIAVTAQGDVTISGRSADGQTRSGVFAKTQGTVANAGAAGDINLKAKNLLLDGGAQIDSSTTSGGRGGSVSVAATEGITLDGVSTRITSDAARGNGVGGSIVMKARNATIREGASVTAATGGTGAAGSVEITLEDTLRMESAGTITTSTRGSGIGGPITIKANQVILDGPGTAITAETLRPFADLAVTLNIQHLNTGDLVAQLDSPAGTRVALFSRVGGNGDHFTGTTLDDQASMPITSASVSAPFTGTFTPREPLAQLIDQPAGGTWTLNLRDAAGNGTGGTLESWSLRFGTQTFESNNDLPIPDNTSVQSNLTVAGALNALVQGTGEVSGAGGNVTIDAGSVTVQNGAALSATSRGSGTGGTLNVDASGAVLVTGTGSGLFSDAEASGRGGDITMQGSSVAVNSGAKVSASSSGTGNAGSITITTPGLFTSTGGAVTTTAVSGQGGDILITAGEVNLNSAVISASSLGPGNAGSIVINSGVQFFSANSMVTTRADQASGGDITVNAQDMIRLINTQINTSVAGGTATTGGNISIDPQFVILQNSKIVAQAFQGTGGNITIVANQFLSDPASIVDASSQLGVSGTVDIRSPITNLDGDVTALPGNVLEVANLLQSSCLARLKGGQISSLIQRGRDEVPAEPGSPAVFPLFAGAVFPTLSTQHSALSTSRPHGLEDGAGIHVIGGEFRIGGLSRLLAENVGQNACSKPGLSGLFGLSG